MPASTPSRIVFFASGLMRSTSASPASMSTPASLYERGEAFMQVLAGALGRRPIEFGVDFSRSGLRVRSPAPCMQFTSTQKRAAAWTAIAVLAVLGLRALGPVLTPFLVASVLAYALTPLVDRLDNVGGGRMPRVL